MHEAFQRRPAAVDVIIAALLFAAVGCDDGIDYAVAGQNSYFDQIDRRTVEYDVPAFMTLRGVTREPGLVRLGTYATVPERSAAPFTFEVRFADVVVAYSNAFRYPAETPFEGAAVLDIESGALLGEAVVEIGPESITLRFDPDLVRGEPLMALTRYLPPGAPLHRIAGGLAVALADAEVLDASLRRRHNVLPPFAGGAIHEIDLEVGGLLAVKRPFGPPDGTSNYTDGPAITLPNCQPGRDPGGDDVIDGRVYEWGIWDGAPAGPSGSDAFLGLCAPDANMNGVMDPDERDDAAVIGKCPWDDTWVTSWVEGNTVYFNVKEKPRSGTREYLYCTDLTTGIMTIYNENGDVVHMGRPQDWPGFGFPSPTRSTPTSSDGGTDAGGGGDAGTTNMCPPTDGGTSSGGDAGASPDAGGGG
jgi:hypothetical protein